MLKKPNLNRSKLRIQDAQTVLYQEAGALKILAETLENDAKFSKNFIKALHLIEASQKKGKLIVTGVGKSGHIAHKLAATFASMGTPAFFIHPAEASHGDLGMITKQDTVLAMSKSGETKEMFDLLAYCNKYKVPVIGMCMKADSMLAKKSDVPLIMPDLPEACPLGKAPTVSTTMTLALGDALSVVTAQRCGLDKDAFLKWHPGGKLGATLAQEKKK
ncbi:MAG: SIS domain-containing protein [Rickettsiales bacterium]|jgi:arabinose-5-phosphate isomerase|nr:SIS domain-containing protein [Rickettsiales bacterium]